MLFFILTPAIVLAKNHNDKKFVDDEILVQFKQNAANKNKHLQNAKATKTKQLDNKGLLRVYLSQGQDIEQVIAELIKQDDVEYAQPNFIYQSTATANDTLYSSLWGLKNTGQTITSPGGSGSPSSENNPGTSGKDMSLESAWNHITDCSSTVVAVVDTGINYTHSDLANNMWDGGVSYPNHGYDFVGDTTDPMDTNGHGTHVAGTIGAIGNNGNGTTGICWNVKLMAVRVLDMVGSGTTADVISGINFAVDNGAKIINLSLGSSSFDTSLNNAITNARSNSVIVVAAAGNDGANNDSGSTPTYPCNFTQDNLICVAALTQTYALASFSNYGMTSVDIGAPGVNIVSEWPGTVTTLSPSLTSGWTSSTTTATGWGYRTLNFGSPPVATACLANPKNYDRATQNYANSTDDRIYRAFNISGANTAVLNFKIMYDIATGDSVSVKVRNAAGDPIPSGTLLASYVGSTAGSRVQKTFDISSFIGTNTTVGFSLQTNASGVSFGTNVSQFSIETLTINSTSYNVIQGTSMAAPHVAGLAAMVTAFNPNYTYSDVLDAIKQGGTTNSALTNKTTTGKSANAMGALSHIKAPTGGAAVKVVLPSK